MNVKTSILLMFLLSSCSIFHFRHKEKRKVITCIVSQTSSYCDIYTVYIYNDKSLKVTFGEKEFNGINYIQVLNEKNIKLSRDNFKKLTALKNKISKLTETETKCKEKGSWQIDIQVDKKNFNFCNGEQVNTVLDELYQEIKKLSPIKFDLHWGGCPN